MPVDGNICWPAVDLVGDSGRGSAATQQAAADAVRDCHPHVFVLVFSRAHDFRTVLGPGNHDQHHQFHRGVSDWS